MKMTKLKFVLAWLALSAFAPVALSGPLDGPSLSPQINGVQDDGSAEGTLKTKITRGQLVKMPFVAGRYATDNITGSATAVHFEGSGQGNPDGSGSTLVFTVPTGGGIRLLQTFYGSVFGVRWIRGTADFGVAIDGIAYRVTSKLSEPETTSAISATAELENLTIVADDLPDVPHVAEFVFANATGGTLTWQLYGYVAEQRVGHGLTPRPTGIAVNATTVPNTDTALMDTTFRSFRKVKYFNTDTVTRTVTIKQNTKIIDTLVMTTLTGREFDLGDWVAFDRSSSGVGSFTHSADAAGVVNFMPIGGL